MTDVPDSTPGLLSEQLREQAKAHQAEQKADVTAAALLWEQAKAQLAGQRADVDALRMPGALDDRAQQVRDEVGPAPLGAVTCARRSRWRLRAGLECHLDHSASVVASLLTGHACVANCDRHRRGLGLTLR